MKNLNFNSQSGWFVTDALDGGSSGIVAYQLTYPNHGAKVIVETCIDESLGWSVADAKIALSNVHGDVINGVIDGLNVRIRTNYLPTQAKVTNL